MYTIINSSVFEIYKGLPITFRLKAMSDYSSLIGSITFKCDARKSDKQLTHNKEDDSWQLDFSDSETSNFELGSYFYELDIKYQDGTQELKPYIGKLLIKEVEDVEDETQ